MPAAHIWLRRQLSSLLRTCSDVTSPALGTAGPLLKRICYGLALPALIASSTIYTHFSAKYIFVRILRGSGRAAHLSSNSFTHWAAWM